MPLLIFLLVSSFLLNILLLLHRGYLWTPQSNILYTPVTGIGGRRPRLFKTGLGKDASIFQGSPSAEKYDSWRALYVHAVAIPRSLAARLPNKTLEIPDIDGEARFIVGINVFHHLHCLHLLSQVVDFTFHPEYYGLNSTYHQFDSVHNLRDINEGLPEAFLDERHIGHCVDSIRQALMCEADLSTYVWQMPPVERNDSLIPEEHIHQSPQVFVDTQRMCVDFDAVRRWAGQRRYEQPLPGSVSGSSAIGRCGHGQSGCGDHIYQDADWRASNTWMDSKQWVDFREGEGDGKTSIFFEMGD
ncbi:hypothetical protein AAFC00_001613 [Neodothiora populina]|uniref:Uncharacterized protein n=1 Tax=Neodothiora populina TaxID=2781224 RepID=A0ABR3PQL7_9PEZI